MVFLKGKFTGKPHIQWENLWFPVDFPLNQSIELWIDLGVSIVMGVPRNRWFRMEHPSINGRFAGTPMSGNPHFEEIQWMAIISKDFSEFSGHYNTLRTLTLHSQDSATMTATVL